MTPSDMHYGLAEAKWHRRAEVLRAAYQAHPERFPSGVPVPPALPTAAWINKPASPVGALAEPAQHAAHGLQAGGALAVARAAFAASDGVGS